MLSAADNMARAVCFLRSCGLGSSPNSEQDLDLHVQVQNEPEAAQIWESCIYTAEAPVKL